MPGCDQIGIRLTSDVYRMSTGLASDVYRIPTGRRIPIGRRTALLAAAFLGGAAFLILEVVWFRFLTFYMPPTGLTSSARTRILTYLNCNVP